MSPKPANPHRFEEESAYVLHSYPYKETSLIVEAFTGAFGRIALVAKGAKRPTSALRGLLLPFQPLAISATGKGEIKTLTRAEWKPGQALLLGGAVMLGYYVNELVMKLVPRDDAQPRLYDTYARTVEALAGAGDAGVALRRFELELLAQLGYGMNLTHCAQTQLPVEAERTYVWQAEKGLMQSEGKQWSRDTVRVQGATLIALANPDTLSAKCANEAKPLMRAVLDFHLEQRSLASRQMLRDIHALSESVA
jgi:DNA repair protein RecO (recombination protein O)